MEYDVILDKMGVSGSLKTHCRKHVSINKVRMELSFLCGHIPPPDKAIAKFIERSGVRFALGYINANCDEKWLQTNLKEIFEAIKKAHNDKMVNSASSIMCQIHAKVREYSKLYYSE